MTNELEARVQQLELQVTRQADQAAVMKEMIDKQTAMLDKQAEVLVIHRKALLLLKTGIVDILSADEQRAYGGLIQ